MKSKKWVVGSKEWWLPPILVGVLLLTLYVVTMAQGLVLGDPTEYTFIANVLGIAHPPGYAFITLVGKLFQTLIPFGSIPWRMHLLAAVSATVASLFVFGTIRTLAPKGSTGLVAATFGALTVGTAVNLWQHAIHTNPHIMTAAFLAANFFFLTKWYVQEESDTATRRHGDPHPLAPSPPRPSLLAFCFSAGLGVTHHPLTVMAFPAYALFIVWIRPSILRDWRTLFKMVAVALLGLLPWLYFPLRSPTAPFGPTTMNTLSGFLDHVLARGLSDSLPYFPLVEQPNRAIVFWSILRLQYSLPTISLAIFAVISPIIDWARKRRGDTATRQPSPPRPLAPSLLTLRPLTLYTLAFLTTYAFVISLRQQDIMAYLLGPLLVVGLLSGIGLLQLMGLLQERLGQDQRPLLAILTVFFLLGPVLQIGRNLPRVSLRDYDEAKAYLEALEEKIYPSESPVAVLNDWERMTPIWYSALVEDETPQNPNVSLNYIAAGSNPWLEGIFNTLPAGDVYLSNFRQGELAGTEFRLRPDEPFYQVVEPGEMSIPEGLVEVTAVAQAITIVGYELPQTEVTAGDFVPLTLAMTAPKGTSDFYIPVLTVGDIIYEFTTDSHLITPNWRPGEVIVERFDFALPFDLGAGEYQASVDIKNLSSNELIETNVALGTLLVAESQQRVRTNHLLANFRQRVGLVDAVVRGNGRRLHAPWPSEQAIYTQPGDVLNIRLTWEALAVPEDSYTIFVHLIDASNQPYVFLDYTPLGGSTPTHLWIPKWLPGQRFIDPYRMVIPENLPSGTYFIEVGLYEFISQRRLHLADQDGNLIGDRYILGTVVVE